MRILYICTHNRCRSILSEAVTRQLANGLIEAKSAGSQPVGEVHPLSLKYLEQCAYSCENLHSQSWEEFADFNPDVIITVCDSAAGETCPLYLSDCLKIHWGLKDPSKLQGEKAEIETAFLDTIKQIEKRVESLKRIAMESLDKASLRNKLEALIQDS